MATTTHSEAGIALAQRDRSHSGGEDEGERPRLRLAAARAVLRSVDPSVERKKRAAALLQ